MVKILEKDSQAKVIILTTYDEEEDVYRAMSAGAWGYLLKDAAPAELVNSIRRVIAGKKAIGRKPPVCLRSAWARLNSPRENWKF